MSQVHQRPIVLLVEDSEDDVFFFHRAARNTGIPCSLFYAQDGDAAVRHLSAALAGENRDLYPHPDLVFLDLKLPGLNGFEVLEWVRTQNAPSPLDISVLSGSDAVSDIERATELGASAYYTKPLTAETLRLVLKGWLDRQVAAAPPT